MTQESHDTRDSQDSTVLCIDLIGPYTIERKNKTKKPLSLWALTMIDPATGWFEMREIKTKSADSVANVLEQGVVNALPVAYTNDIRSWERI